MRGSNSDVEESGTGGEVAEECQTADVESGRCEMVVDGADGKEDGSGWGYIVD